MNTIKELKIKDWTGYIFKEMINILDIEPEYCTVNDFKRCKDGSILFNSCYSDETGVSHIVFNNIDCIFKKSGIYSYLIFLADGKHKDTMKNYGKIIKQLENDIFSFIDGFEDEEFNFNGSFVRFRFKTDDNLVYNKIINIPVCIISLSSIVKKGNNYYPNFQLQRCFFFKINLIFKKSILF